MSMATLDLVILNRMTDFIFVCKKTHFQLYHLPRSFTNSPMVRIGVELHLQS